MNRKTLLCFTTFNKLEVTRECMEYACELGYDILVIDDCSTDGTQAYLTTIGVEFISKRERLGLTDSWNRAYAYFKASDYDYMVLCNNDVLIPSGAVENLISPYPLTVPMTTNEGAGYACKAQDVRKYWPNLVSQYKGIQDIQDRLSVKYKFQRADCWTGFCMCMSRDIIEFERSDGNLFDPAKINVGNDDDLASRVEAYLSVGSFVYHYKGVSFDGRIAGRDDLGWLQNRNLG